MERDISSVSSELPLKALGLDHYPLTPDDVHDAMTNHAACEKDAARRVTIAVARPISVWHQSLRPHAVSGNFQPIAAPQGFQQEIDPVGPGVLDAGHDHPFSPYDLMPPLPNSPFTTQFPSPFAGSARDIDPSLDSSVQNLEHAVNQV